MHLSRVAFALLGSTVLALAAIDAATCALSVSSSDAAVGISIITDMSCRDGGYGCIDSACRYCAATKTPQSSQLLLCTSIDSARDIIVTKPDTPMTPGGVAKRALIVNKAAMQESGTEECTSKVSDGDCEAGIRITTDLACVSGGVGCFSAVCRYCQAVSTPNSAHLKNCTGIPGYISTFCSPSTTTSAPTSAPIPAPDPSPTFAPTPTPTSAPTPTLAPAPTQVMLTSAIPLICVASVSKGDEDAGLAVVTDQTCSDHGTGCLGNVCRLCKRYDSPQSNAYKACTAIPSPPDLSDITFKPIPVFNDAGASISSEPLTMITITESPDDQTTSEPAETTSEPAVTTSKPAVTTTSEPAVTTTSKLVVTCTMVVSQGDCEAGLEIELDTGCLTAGKVGCIPPSACKFCRWNERSLSSVYDECVATTFIRAPTCVKR
jgi:hypothetical protein